MASPCLPTRIGLLAVVALLAVFPRRGSAAGCDGRASGCTVFAKAKDVREKVETLALETAAKIEADFANPLTPNAYQKAPVSGSLNSQSTQAYQQVSHM